MRVSTIWLPRSHASNLYAPVPMGSSMKSPVPPVESMYSCGWICNEEKATLLGSATSGLHIVNFTVELVDGLELGQVPV